MAVNPFVYCKIRLQHRRQSRIESEEKAWTRRKIDSQLPGGLLCCDSMLKAPLMCSVHTHHPAAAKLESLSSGLKASTLCADQD